MRRILFLVPVLLFLLLAMYFAVSLRPGYDPHILPSALLDRPAPDFALPGLKERGLALADLKGRPAVINFFASWCLPCRIEHPLLMRLAKDTGVALYGIAYKDKPEDAARFLAGLGDPYRAVGLDRDGQTGLDFGVYGVPETFVIDANGIIRRRFAGPLTADIVAREITPLLKSPP